MTDHLIAHDHATDPLTESSKAAIAPIMVRSTSNCGEQNFSKSSLPQHATI